MEGGRTSLSIQPFLYLTSTNFTRPVTAKITIGMMRCMFRTNKATATAYILVWSIEMSLCCLIL